MSRRNRIYLIVALIFACFLHAYNTSQSLAASQSLQEARVIEVNDGDTVTLKIDNRVYRTRLIGIDAPEMGQRPWGRRAKEHLIGIMDHAGWTVYVETDVVKRDKYDRLLAYLWTKEKEFINEQMVLDGHAVLFTIRPNSKYAGLFSRAQHRAQQEKLNIWGPKGLKESPAEYRKKHPRTERVRSHFL